MHLFLYLSRGWPAGTNFTPCIIVNTNKYNTIHHVESAAERGKEGVGGARHKGWAATVTSPRVRHQHGREWEENNDRLFARDLAWTRRLRQALSGKRARLQAPPGQLLFIFLSAIFYTQVMTQTAYLIPLRIACLVYVACFHKRRGC